MTTDNTQELNEIIDIFQDYTASLGYPINQLSHTRGRQIHRQAILDWHNKQVGAVLDRLEPLTHEGRGTIAWEMDNMLSAIQAERNKLKKQTNDRL